MVSSESPGRERAATTLLRRFQTGAARRAEEETSSTSGASSGSSRSSSTRRANAGVVTAVRGLGDRFGAGARRRERETRKAELSDGRRRRRDDASANDGGEGGTGTGRVSASTSTFDVAENARLALEAKDAQLRRMAARVAALEAERDAEAVSAVEADARAFEGAANSLEDDMRAALEEIRAGGSDIGSDRASGPKTPAREEPRARAAEAYAPVAFASRDGEEDEAIIEERDDADEDDDGSSGRRERPEPIKPSVPVEGGYLTPSGKLVGSALKRKTDGKPSSSTAGTPAPRDAGAATHKTVVFNDRDEYSDAPSAPVDASVVEELQTELREVRAALKSAFSVSEKLVAQCEKKNREIQEKTMAVKLAREEVEKSRADARAAVAAANAERTSANERARERADDAELGERLDDAMKTLEMSRTLNERLTRVITSSVSVNAETSPEVVFAVLPVLAGLAVRGDFAEALASGGAFDALEYALDVFAADASVCRRALECVLCMSRAGEGASAAATDDDDVARLRSKLTDAAVDACGRAVARCAEDHVENARVAEIACLIALSFAECAASDKMSFFVRECRGVDVVCQITETHAANERVQRAATRALAALATRDERTKRAVERRGGIDLIARCADELGVDDAAREFPQVKRWISGVKTREDRERKERSTTTADDDDEDGVDVSGNL